jgi:hypothetical protein
MSASSLGVTAHGVLPFSNGTSRTMLTVAHDPWFMCHTLWNIHELRSFDFHVGFLVLTAVTTRRTFRYIMLHNPVRGHRLTASFFRVEI